MQTELETQVYGFLKNCGGGGLIILNKTIELWRWRFKTIECGGGGGGGGGLVAALAVVAAVVAAAVVVVVVAVVVAAVVVVVVEFKL